MRRNRPLGRPYLLFAPYSGRPTRTRGLGNLRCTMRRCGRRRRMNRSSTSTVVVEAPSVAYEGLLTSVASPCPISKPRPRDARFLPPVQPH